ncbi:hypothetical protein ACFV9C_04775 [Kribbella sp. NPDC059898]|uniref:hypothetical protein n=1 Tax=Kribbella sp. NPDC059898 TaxID=3346995 RepID=UPI00365CF994
MSVINVERIKLFSTRSPWWCMVVAAVLSLGLAALATGFLKGDQKQQATIFMTQGGTSLSQMVMMVMAALAVTTEYRFGTIRTSFQAVPQRAQLLLGKTVVVAALAALVGEIAAFGGWGIGKLLASGADLSINTGAEWRLVAGRGLIFFLSAVVAVAVAILLRHTAGAIALLILWPLAVEQLFSLIPKVGDDMTKWSPFQNASAFIAQGNDGGLAGSVGDASNYALGPWMSLLYFAGWAVVLMAIALFTASKRDA